MNLNKPDQMTTLTSPTTTYDIQPIRSKARSSGGDQDSKSPTVQDHRSGDFKLSASQFFSGGDRQAAIVQASVGGSPLKLAESRRARQEPEPKIPACRRPQSEIYSQ
ncbi:hypothetical protein E3N88_25518 [Mikania micrantha]|uniref:Uncharacterized protein n=1 Tax=Mikania micrantha TaxID=192012 RepID=A0A5N6N6M0_9ASTR|nr:hypothetical protein E3N88_25518 [Mikania micrantha]